MGNVLHRAGHESDSPADFGSALNWIQNLKPFLADREALIALAISIAAAMLLVVLAMIPLVLKAMS